MNKEQKKFKKIIKARIKHNCKRKVFDQFSRNRQIEFTLQKDRYIKAKKEQATNILNARFARFDYIRKALNIPDHDIYSLDALEKMYEKAKKVTN